MNAKNYGQSSGNNSSGESFGDVLRSSHQLSKIMLAYKKIEIANQILLSHLSPELARHCQVANWRNGTLILVTTSPAWHHKLRFLKDKLLRDLRQNDNFRNLKFIDIKTQVAYTPVVPPKPPKRHLTPANAQVLIDAAAEVKSPRLAKALLKLSRHAD